MDEATTFRDPLKSNPGQPYVPYSYVLRTVLAALLYLHGSSINNKKVLL